MDVSKKYVFLSVSLLIYVMLYGTHTAECDTIQTNSVPQTRVVQITSSTKPDNLDDSSEQTRKIYDGVRFLLAYRMHTWIQRKDINLSEHSSLSITEISSYLGLPKKTVDLIDIAMSLLISKRNDGNICIDNLLEAFFYSCNVKNMLDVNSTLLTRINNVVDNFGQLMKNLRIDEAVIGGRKEDVLVSELQNALKNSISEDQVNMFSWRSVTIPSMENLMYVFPEKSEESAKILMQQRIMDGVMKGYQLQETNGEKVIANHLQLIASLIPNIFRYLYNHIDLVAEFRRRKYHLLNYVNVVDKFTEEEAEEDQSIVIPEDNEAKKDKSVVVEVPSGKDESTTVKIKLDIVHFRSLHEEDQEFLKEIMSLNGFMENLQEAFLDRYFYLKGEEFDSLLKDAVNSLTNFMYMVHGFPPKNSIANFYNSGEEYDKKMWELVNNVLNRLLVLFERNENVECWNKKRIATIGVNYSDKQLDKKALLKLLRSNREEAFAAQRPLYKSLVPKETIQLVSLGPISEKSEPEGINLKKEIRNKKKKHREIKNY